MAAFVEAAAGIFTVSEARTSRKDAAKANKGKKTAPVASESQGQSASDDFFSGTRKRRQIASTVQGGQVKRNTLGSN